MSGGALSGKGRQGTGLPGPLPAGEAVLWEGAPRASALVRRVLHGRNVMIYFAALALVIAGRAWSEGRVPGSIAVSLAVVAAAALATLAIICTFAVLIARTTRYTITSRRIVMRIGIALPITLNLPFAIVAGASVRLNPDGTGDLPVALSGKGRIGFLHLWPHARPWRLSNPEPTLRAVPEAAQVAAILARALGAGPLGRAAAARDGERLATSSAAHAAA